MPIRRSSQTQTRATSEWRAIRSTEMLPPAALGLSFVDCINRQDVGGLGALMSADHRLQVFDEDPLVGREANINAWRGYFESFPRYVIHPHRIAERGDIVAILGHTTGSHLALPDEEERKLTLIWLVETASGAVTRWTLVEDSSRNRSTYGLDKV